MIDATHNAILCRYGEIALKGNNRSTFERALVTGMKRVLSGIEDLRYIRERGRILLHRKNFTAFTAAHENLIAEGLHRVFGLQSYSMGYMVESNLEAIEKIIGDTLPQHYGQELQAGNGPVTYRMRARRANKFFPLRSQELEIHFADLLLPQYDNLKLDLDNATISIGVEVRENWTFVHYGKIPGPGGLPVGASAPVLVLLSGGIDSPGAAYLAMKRGSHTNFLTFHSAPYTPPETIDKVCGIVQVINRFQKPGLLLACNLVAAQKIIRDRTTEKYRTVLYRRLMMRVASRLATEIGDRALVTGDCLAQVASQTVQNLEVINNATDRLILRPLIGYDKTESMALARRVGTLKLSEIQCADSCTVFAPSNPATNATLNVIHKQESRMDTDELLELALAGVTVINPTNVETSPFRFNRTKETQLTSAASPPTS